MLIYTSFEVLNEMEACHLGLLRTNSAQVSLRRAAYCQFLSSEGENWWELLWGWSFALLQREARVENAFAILPQGISSFCDLNGSHVPNMMKRYEEILRLEIKMRTQSTLCIHLCVQELHGTLTIQFCWLCFAHENCSGFLHRCRKHVREQMMALLHWLLSKSQRTKYKSTTLTEATMIVKCFTVVLKAGDLFSTLQILRQFLCRAVEKVWSWLKARTRHDPELASSCRKTYGHPSRNVSNLQNLNSLRLLPVVFAKMRRECSTRWVLKLWIRGLIESQKILRQSGDRLWQEFVGGQLATYKLRTPDFTGHVKGGMCDPLTPTDKFGDQMTPNKCNALHHIAKLLRNDSRLSKVLRWRQVVQAFWSKLLPCKRLMNRCTDWNGFSKNTSWPDMCKIL